MRMGSVLGVVLVGATCGACAEASSTPRPSDTASAQADARAGREAREAEMLARYKRQTTPDDSYERRERDQRIAFDQEKADRERKLIAECDQTRQARMSELAAYLERSDHIDELREWESAHCKVVDDTKPVIRQVQDSNGEYHTVEGRDHRLATRRCNAKLPAELQHGSAFNMTPGASPYSTQFMHCKDADIQASPVAAKYWAE